jgi:hypothetical protein
LSRQLVVELAPERVAVRDKRIATFGGVWYVLSALATEGWLSGLKRRFAKPAYDQVGTFTDSQGKFCNSMHNKAFRPLVSIAPSSKQQHREAFSLPFFAK